LGKIPRNKRRAFTALRFLFKEGEAVGGARETAHINIPKTVVFFDTKDETNEALEECLKWLENSKSHRYTPQQIESAIRVFHRFTPEHDKEVAITEFRKLATESSVRVIFATEALGVGVNIPDIRRVVQYGIPKGYHPAVPWQCGGRGSRDGKDGEINLLVDEWAFGQRDEAAAQKYAQQSKGQRLVQDTSVEDPAEDANGEEALQQEQTTNSLGDK
jgi:superfamily II DNA/RNA helicase